MQLYHFYLFFYQIWRSGIFQLNHRWRWLRPQFWYRWWNWCIWLSRYRPSPDTHDPI